MNDSDKTSMNEIIYFWFTETSMKQKFMKDLAFDQIIISRFQSVYNDIISGKKTDWNNTPEGVLAQIIVLDQFSRNMFRGDKKSFEYDNLALRLAKNAIKDGIDQKLSYEQRCFIYMPYMHSESRETHKEALKIFTEYGNEGNLEYEIKHKKIIDRFGRYPHRNQVLGRESTEEEIEFLKSNPGF